MNEGLPWMRVLLMLGLLTAMFSFPVVVLTLQGRAKRRAIDDPEGTEAAAD